MHAVIHLRPWALLVLIALAGIAHAQSTAFTYQGRLQENGNLVTGTYDVRAALYSTVAMTPIVPPVTVLNVAVQQGVFAISLDFGGAFYFSADRLLEISVRKAGTEDPFVALAPKQLLTSAPSAHYAHMVPWSGITGVPADLYTAGAGLTLEGSVFRVADNGVASGMLATEAASLRKVSGGLLTATSVGLGVKTTDPAGLLDIRGLPYAFQDQAQTAINYYATYYNDVWQSFTPSVTGDLYGLAVNIGMVVDEDGIWNGALTVYEGTGDTGALLHQQSATIRGARTWREFTLTTLLPLRTGTTYTFKLAGDVSKLDYVASNQDPYAGGRMSTSAVRDLCFYTYMAPPALRVSSATGRTSIAAFPDAVAMLNVGGKIKAEGLIIPSSAGAGKVLTSDVDGNATWQTPTMPIEGVTSAMLANDPASLYRVSGGKMTLNGNNITTAGRVNGVLTKTGVSLAGAGVTLVDFTGVTTAHGEVHYGSVTDNQWVDVWYVYDNGVLMGDMIRNTSASANETYHFRWSTATNLYSSAAPYAGYLRFNATAKTLVLYESGASDDRCLYRVVDQQ